MPTIQQTTVTRAIRVIAGLIGMLAVGYVAWFLYAIYVLYPNPANTSPIGFIGVSLMTLLAAVTVMYSWLIWQRTLRVHDQPWRRRLFTTFMIVFPVAVSPLSPTTLVFVVFAGVLTLMNSLFRW